MILNINAGFRRGHKTKRTHKCECAICVQLQAGGWAGWIRTIAMTESKSVALPLGYSPSAIEKGNKNEAKIFIFASPHFSGVEDGIRTHDLQCHKLAL